MKEDRSKGSILALLEGTAEDDTVISAAGAAARPGQSVVLLRVMAPVTRSGRRGGVLAGPVIEPWEQMEARERNARRRLAAQRSRLAPDRAAELHVRFGDPVEETLQAAAEAGAVRVVTAGGRRNVRLARRLSDRLQVPVLLATEAPARREARGVGSRTELLRTIPALAGMSRSSIRKLAAHLDEVSVGAGTTLMSEGRRNQALWIIVEGSAELSVRGTQVRRFGPGDVVGATSMLDGRGATGTVVTSTSVRALVAGPEDFRAIEGDTEIELRLKAASREVLLAEVRALASA